MEVGRNSDLSLAYDWDGLDVEGNSETVDAVEFVFRTIPISSPDLRVLRMTPSIVVGENSYRVDDLFITIPDGEFNITTRLRDIGGNWSAESVGIAVEITSKNPSRPTNMRVAGR